MDDLIQKAVDYLENQSDVITAYLFGSVARNKARKSSDLDFAFLFANPIGDKMGRFECFLEKFTKEKWLFANFAYF